MFALQHRANETGISPATTTRFSSRPQGRRGTVVPERICSNSPKEVLLLSSPVLLSIKGGAAW